jgi:hypothetical protein
LGVGGGWSKREGESEILAKIASGSPLLLCPTAWDKEKMREGERDGRLGCVLVEFAKKEEKRKEKEKDLMNLAEFHLNFEKFKVLIQRWW